jgi:CDGSH-type Zn-finger protein/uncharacterized Fe-S cluster protein YjdI
MADSKIEIVSSDEVRILFDTEKCIHARNCVLSRPDVFVPNVEGAWLHPERATPDEIVELAHNCPSGAIRYERLDGGEAETPPRVNLVYVRENGPLAVHAEATLKTGETFLRATLCRCGASKNKPFCDGTHATIGFSASGEASPRETPALEVRNGPVSITPIADGPLKLSGPLEIVSGTGQTIARVTAIALCRCGQSKNKPFCDGSHASANFKADG